MKLTTPPTGSLQGKDLNDLPAVFAMYGFWGGSNITNYPTGIDPAGCLLLTIPIGGASNMYQIFITTAYKIYGRRRTYQNVWEAWALMN